MNEGYKSRAFNLMPKKKKKRKEEYKVNDFVDSMKFIDASSSDEEDPYKKARSKAAREELESENPDESKNERLERLARINKKRLFDKTYSKDHKPRESRDSLLKEIDSYQINSKKQKLENPKRSTKKSKFLKKNNKK